MCVYVNLSVYAHASTQIECRWNTGISDGSEEDKWGCSTTAISWCSTFKSFNCCRRCVLGHWTRMFRSKRSKVWTVRSHDSLFVKKIQDSWKKTARERKAKNSGNCVFRTQELEWICFVRNHGRGSGTAPSSDILNCQNVPLGTGGRDLCICVWFICACYLTTEVWVDSSERRKA